jgi:hypothetical protein
VKSKRIGKVKEIINTLHKQLDEDQLLSQSNPRDIDNNGMQTVVDHQQARVKDETQKVVRDGRLMKNRKEREARLLNGAIDIIRFI